MIKLYKCYICVDFVWIHFVKLKKMKMKLKESKWMLLWYKNVIKEYKFSNYLSEMQVLKEWLIGDPHFICSHCFGYKRVYQTICVQKKFSQKLMQKISTFFYINTWKGITSIVNKQQDRDLLSFAYSLLSGSCFIF